jgi:hypothetical protein
MFIIGDAVIDDVVGTASFRCDLSKCKGACCTLPGGRGAPLADEEVSEIQQAFPAAAKYLSARNLDVIATLGMVEGTPGSFATTCINDRDCVFVYYDGDVAKCSLERAYEEGVTGWRKPLSCHLFPIRVRSLGNDYLVYRAIEECKPARELGVASHTFLHDFLKEPLTRLFGEEWYARFIAQCKNQL